MKYYVTLLHKYDEIKVKISAESKEEARMIANDSYKFDKLIKIETKEEMLMSYVSPYITEGKSYYKSNMLHRVNKRHRKLNFN